jgi:hypothetical protein
MLLGAAGLPGCGEDEGSNRQAISGFVTCDQKPMPSGAILFEPAARQSGPAVGSTIENGSFAIGAQDGAVPGHYRVRVYMSSGVQAAPTRGQSDRTSRPMLEALPARYNAKTELDAEVSDVRSNRFRFDLSTDERPATK